MTTVYLSTDRPAEVLPENSLEALFCSMDCMKNPVKFIEYTKIEYKYSGLAIKTIDYSTEKVLKKVSEYYSKDSNDIAVLIDFITKINKEMNEDFNLTTANIKILLENSGNFFLFSKTETSTGIVKSKIQLKPIELKTV